MQAVRQVRAYASGNMSTCRGLLCTPLRSWGTLPSLWRWSSVSCWTVRVFHPREGGNRWYIFPQGNPLRGRMRSDFPLFSCLWWDAWSHIWDGPVLEVQLICFLHFNDQLPSIRSRTGYVEYDLIVQRSSPPSHFRTLLYRGSSEDCSAASLFLRFSPLPFSYNRH